MLIDLKIVPVEGANVIVPSVQTKQSACADLPVCFDHVDTINCYDYINVANAIVIEEDDIGKFVKIYPGERVMLPTGLRMIIPHGYQIKIVPRSGISFKTGMMLLNSPGTVDSDYTDEIKLLIKNTSDVVCVVRNHDRMAQMEIRENTMQFVLFHEGTEEELLKHKETSNRNGGFGSTGIK